MMTRLRTLAATALAAVALAGCVQQTQLTSPEQAAAFRVTDVTVEATRAASAEQRGFNIGEAEAEARLRAQVLDVLDDVNPEGTRNVVVALDVGSIFVPNIVSGAVGRSASGVTANAQLRDATTGAALGQPFEVQGSGQFRLGGSPGAVLTAASLATGGERGEIDLAGQGLGRNLAQAIFGVEIPR